MTTERIRTTISIEPSVYEVFKRMADSAGMSVSRCMGEWLADTADGAQFVALKMEEARKAPIAVMREMQAMANGLSHEVTSSLQTIRNESKASQRPSAGLPRRAAASSAPSSNTGLKSPSRRTGTP
jgi:hypothetical protein